jgi:hypothetical protein
LSGLQDGELEPVVWDIEHEFNTESSGWKAKVKKTIPRIEEDEMYLLRQLKQEIRRVGYGNGTVAARGEGNGDAFDYDDDREGEDQI